MATFTITGIQNYQFQLQIDAPTAAVAAALFDTISTSMATMIASSLAQIPPAGSVPNLTVSNFTTQPWQITLVVH